MGTLTLCLLGEKGKAVLDYLIEDMPGVVDRMVVIVGTDKCIDNDHSVEMLTACKQRGIRCFLRNEVSIGDISEQISKPGIIIAAGWRWMLQSKEDTKLIIFHDSLLPKYRGFNPLVTALIEGETKVGVSAIYGESEYDAGKIVFQESTRISYPIRVRDAIDQILPLYKMLTKRVIESALKGKLPKGYIQSDKEATYSLWRDEDDYFIKWHESASRIRRKIDASGPPYSGAKAYLNDKIVTIHAAEEIADIVIANRDCGKVVRISNSEPIVVCGSGLLKITSATDVDGQNVIPLRRFRSRFS